MKRDSEKEVEKVNIDLNDNEQQPEQPEEADLKESHLAFAVPIKNSFEPLEDKSNLKVLENFSHLPFLPTHKICETFSDQLSRQIGQF